MEFTHFDKEGNAAMVDVSAKDVTQRIAVAEGSITVSSECYEKIEEITQLTLDHANAVERENEKLRRETEVIAQAAEQLQEENRRFREGSNGDEI